MVDMRTPMSNRDPPVKKVILRIPLLLTVVSRSRCDATFVPLESCRHSEPVYINFGFRRHSTLPEEYYKRAAASGIGQCNGATSESNIRREVCYCGEAIDRVRPRRK